MVAVLNERWLSQGWRVMDRKDAEPMALIWIRQLDLEGVPYRQYEELYRRSVQLRANRMAQGLKCDDFSVDLMLACWPALQQELKQREVATGRTLTGNAETQCPRCFGTGLENRFDIDGRVIGVVTGRACDHRSVDEGEPLFAVLQEQSNVVAGKF
jgi:hypothetical protein